MNNNVMTMLFTITGFILILLLLLKIKMYIEFRKEVKHLFSVSKEISDKKFNYAQLAGLPKPVQRYFKHVLKAGQPYISYVRLLHDGQFKTGLDKGWIDIKGEQYFSTEKPGFVWKGTTSVFTAKDSYLNNKGNLTVSLFSLYDIVNGHGATFDQSELLRWLAESIWFPTSLLPSDRIQWIGINDNTAKLSYNYNGFSLFYIVTFNDKDEIKQLETKRYIDADKLESWIGKLNDYKEINGVIVPTVTEAFWRLENVDISYAKFRVIKIEYDQPRIF